MGELLQTIVADEYFLGAIDGAEIVAFAERSTEGGPTLLLSRSINPSDQDRELGQDEVYVEVCDQSRSQYGGLLSIEVDHDFVRIRFDADTARTLHVTECLEIRTGASDIDRHLLVEKVKEVLGKHIEITDLTGK